MLNLTTADLKKTAISTLIVPVCEDMEIHEKSIIKTLIREAKKLKEFKGKTNDEIILYNMPSVKPERIFFTGIGKIEKLKPDVFRSLAGRIVKACATKGLSEILFVLPSAKRLKIETESVVEAFLEGAYLGNHLFDRYKKDKKVKPLKRISFMVPPDVKQKFNHLPKRVETICQGTILAREWVSMPPNDKTPELFSKRIVSMAKKEKLKVTVLNEKEMKRMKFGSLLAVSAGSVNKPCMVVMEYNPVKSTKEIVFVGKGVTFDSGGINLKSADGLDSMKMDMAGAAAAAASLITVAKLKPRVKVTGVIPLVENMPSGSAARPGDIVKSYSGKTVEIGNTDAEGRLILIDALSYIIKKNKPDIVIDMATLTGACVVALGEKIAGVFSPDDELSSAIIKSGEKTDERCWRLPLPEDYKELIKSDFADIKNIASSRYGGAITAALFLAEFRKKTKWAHIDIAGPAYAKKGNAYCGPGGTGFGVRLFCDLLDKI
ncbi:MAG: leucyl aminopeptidase [Deltaproteobacteria bacterium]|nr:leucyl aminopeptidase [Deltaproteobacteria bacterium]